MTDAAKLYLSVGLAVAAIAGYLGWRTEERRIGAAEAATATLRVENTTLKGMIVADSMALAKRDTVKLFAAIDTGHTVIQRLIDTAHVYHTDTVKITIERLVTIDSTTRACRVTVSECATLANDRAKRIAVLDSLNKALTAAQPGFLERRLSVALGYGCTENAGKASCGPGVLAGIRLWP